MLIVNDEQRRLAGVVSLEERCKYCSKAFAEYPLILSDDVDQTVYHATCAVQLATEILVDLFTFLSPPPPYHRLYVLTAPEAAPTRDDTLRERVNDLRGAEERVSTKEVTDAVNDYPPDQGGSLGASIHWWDTGEVSNGACGCHQKEEGATPGDDTWVGPLVQRGECEH